MQKFAFAAPQSGGFVFARGSNVFSVGRKFCAHNIL